MCNYLPAYILWKDLFMTDLRLRPLMYRGDCDFNDFISGDFQSVKIKEDNSKILLKALYSKLLVLKSLDCLCFSEAN